MKQKFIARSDNLSEGEIRRAPTVEAVEAELGRHLTPLEARPVARVGDKTFCPHHGAGLIIGPGANVIIGGKPVARITDKCACLVVTKPPPNPDLITSGSSGVFVGGLPVARVGDTTQHGGAIVEGSPDVFIGGGTSDMVELPKPESHSFFHSLGNIASEAWDGGWGLVDLGMIIVDVATVPSGEAGAGIGARRAARAVQRSARRVAPNAKVWPRVGRIHIDPNKVGKQMAERGWSEQEIADTIRSPHKVFRGVDHRRGARDPATAYVREDGNYVMRNDRTGEVFHVSDRNNPRWKAPWQRNRRKKRKGRKGK